MKDEDNITPITGITAPPLPPIAPFFAWTWSSPVIPEFYWNVYSAEQRIKQICLEIGKIEAYLQYFCMKANEAHADLHKKIDEANKRIDELTEQFNTEVANLNSLIAKETADRIAADNKLQSNIDTEAQTRAEADSRLQSNIEAEAGIRADADNTLQANIDKEAKARQDADNSLHEEISAETTARIHADDVLHGEISAEATARTNADAQLQTAITTETEQRKQQDEALSNRIVTEVNDRTTADATLQKNITTVDNRVTEVATDLTEEVDARQAADATLQNDINTRLTPGDIVAANRITVTRGPDNKVTVGDTFDEDFDAVESSVAGIQAALEAETSERRNDDKNLQTQINNRIELGKVLGTAPVKVTNDPDATTATISVDAATASNAGVMSLETVRNQSLPGNGLKADVTGGDRYMAVNPKPGEGIAATAEGVSVQLNPSGGLYHTDTGVAANLTTISSAVAGSIAGKGLVENTETHKLDVKGGYGIAVGDEVSVDLAGIDIPSSTKAQGGLGFDDSDGGLTVVAGKGIFVGHEVNVSLTEHPEPHLVDRAMGGLGFDDEGGLTVAAGNGIAVGDVDGRLGIHFSETNRNDSLPPMGKSGLALDPYGGVHLAIKPYSMTPIKLDPDGYVTVAGGQSITTYGPSGGALDVNPMGLYEVEYPIDDVQVSYDLNGASTLPSNQYIPLTATMSDSNNRLPLMTRFLLTTTTGLQANRLDYRVESVNYQSRGTIVVEFGIRFVGDSVTTDYQLDGTTFELVPYRMEARGPEVPTATD